MSSSGAVTLGDIADKITMLEVACSRSERLGRLSIAITAAQPKFPEGRALGVRN
jgi:hypothetical protein